MRHANNHYFLSFGHVKLYIHVMNTFSKKGTRQNILCFRLLREVIKVKDHYHGLLLTICFWWCKLKRKLIWQIWQPHTHTHTHKNMILKPLFLKENIPKIFWNRPRGIRNCENSFWQVFWIAQLIGSFT